jgi:hypothetical protein
VSQQTTFCLFITLLLYILSQVWWFLPRKTCGITLLWAYISSSYGCDSFDKGLKQYLASTYRQFSDSHGIESNKYRIPTDIVGYKPLFLNRDGFFLSCKWSIFFHQKYIRQSHKCIWFVTRMPQTTILKPIRIETYSGSIHPLLLQKNLRNPIYDGTFSPAVSFRKQPDLYLKWIRFVCINSEDGQRIATS